MYQDFAEVYDSLMGDVDYNGWADFYCRIMNIYGLKEGRICECACGTGNLTLPLYRRGFSMTGVDMSQEMLFQAAQKARKAGAAIPFVCQDMRKLTLHRQMDAVLATCDGVNYLLRDEDALAFFQAAYRALRPGGGLFFDVSTPWKLKESLGNRIICEDREDITYMWQNRFSEKTGIVNMHLCIFVRQKDGSYRRMDEEQKQRAHTAESLTALLRKAGFSQISVYGNDRPAAPAAHEMRWHFAAMRPADDGEEGSIS